MSVNAPSNTPTPFGRNENPALTEIRRRAYSFYEQRGKKDGHDVDDWLQAEQEVLDSLNMSRPCSSWLEAYLML